MKKLFLILIVTAITSTAWSQSQLSTVRGKTKDGKTVKVEYYQGAVEDVIKSVKYQLVDELQAEVTNLQNKLKTQQTKLDESSKQIKQLQADLKQCREGADKNLREQLAEKEKQIQKLKDDIKATNEQIVEKDAEIERLKKQLVNDSIVIDSLSKKKVIISGGQEREMNRLRDENATLKKQLTDCQDGNNKPVVKPTRTPVIGLEVGMGPAFPGSSISEPWAKEVKSCLQADVYFGTARAKSFPVSLEVGLGVRKFDMAATLNEYSVTLNSTDADGDIYHAIYDFNGLEENLSLTYFDVPIRLCFGQPTKEKVSVYAKLGLTPSINVASKFEGKGTYNLKGYYPQWDVTLENVEQLGFGTDLDCYENVEAEINTFNLWGNVAFGAYVPFKGSHVVLNAGLKLDYPIMGIGTINTTDNLPNGQAGLLCGGGKVVVPSVEVGLVYTLK